MVKAKRKSIDEIQFSLSGCTKVLALGCGGCVSVCLAGGLKETDALRDELNDRFKAERTACTVESYTVERQCNPEFLAEIDSMIQGYDAILSLACGAGVQFTAERFPHKKVFPAVNTVFIGIDRAVGLYEERCRACGECVLAYTGAICPVTRCAKSIFNGPCGGTHKGKCEVSKDIPCAWNDIYERLKSQNRLESILSMRPSMSWRNNIQGAIIQTGFEKRYGSKESETK